ncbi:DUF1062 domain-containing protein [Candidatus Entotheonella palauensis]|uniref:DUF1062 domain-containing protein n=1 Tax=Candidatus Entotheonella gemina TaxID=1429439 RepID=W4LZ05_9BACT|nr:DUF1062 domain-containing protein [Candidatus Entotheonella palauensis]ETX03299.1 MAG: hypothetical protein ETSY2_33830 [Candidatus Entotheonella gemina]
MARSNLSGQTVRLRVIALETPHLIRHCLQCGRQSRFVSSDRFRMNAHQRQIDVWLIYRCQRCETTWNCPLFLRCRPGDLDEALYHQLQVNDRAAAWRYAFDAERFQRLHIPADFAVPYRTEYDPVAPAIGEGHHVNLELELTMPCQVRLDRLLAGALDISRTQVQRWLKQGRLDVHPNRPQALRKVAQSGQCIVIRQAPAKPFKTYS